MRYEYIRLYFDYGDLAELNRLAATGWRVVSVGSAEQNPSTVFRSVALLERPLPPPLGRPDTLSIHYASPIPPKA